MKRIFRNILCLSLSSLLLTSFSFAQDTLQQNNQVVIGWLKQNAISIKHVEAGNGFSDFQPFKKILKDVNVLGVGETTHGTREFFQFKHRLFEFLATEMGFTVFTLEASYAGCQPINDYVLYGKGDRATVLSGQGFVLWDTEELSALIDWMRAYNQKVLGSKKVRFYGLDLWYNGFGREKVLEYLKKYDTGRVPETDALFAILAQEEDMWPMRMDEIEPKVKVLLPQVESLIDHLANNKSMFVSASSTGEFKQILKYVQVMRQWLVSIVNDPLSQPKNSVRSKFKAENLLYLMEAMPDAKFVAWEHNDHTGYGYPVTGSRNMGSTLRDKIGKAYYAMGFEFDRGSYQSRLALADRIPGDLVKDTVPTAPEKSLPWYLTRANKGNLFLNLRVSRQDSIVEQWLINPQIVRKISWIHQEDASQNFEKVSIKSRYDGILFIDSTTSVRPTPNALEAASKREKF